MNAPVTGSPVMDELRRQAKEHCLDRRTLLGYSSYDSDDDSDRSVQRKDARVDRADRKVRGRTWLIDSVFNIRLSSLVQAELYHSPSSRESPEKIYASPSEGEWYSESPPRKSLSPATVKKINEEIEAVSSPEYDHWDPTGKTPDEIAAWCADYERDQIGEMAKRWRRGIDSTLFLFARTVQ